MLGGGLPGGAVVSICDLVSAACVALNIDDENIWKTAEFTSVQVSQEAAKT